MAARGDIPLEPPVTSHPQNVPAQEDRSYLGFIAGALASAVLGGFVLAAWAPLAATGTVPGGSRLPWLIQAHGWVQLQGWAGLFVAGMGVRLLPRFAGRKPVPRSLTIPLLAVLATPVVLRMGAQTWTEGSLAEASGLAIGFSTGAGAAGFAAILGWTLVNGRKPREPWRYFAWAGAAWWAAWALLAVRAGFDAAGNNGLAPVLDNDTLAWFVLLGPIGNFIWSVQSRSVPIFFGRKTPGWRRALGPGLLLNSGVGALAISTFLDGTAAARAEGVGLAAAGAALLALPLIAGAAWGQAKRLRPRAKPAARIVLAGNVSAVAAGALLLWGGANIVADGERTSIAVRDAARHLYGIGLISMLILGMARLVAPVFALERTESDVPRLYERAPFWLLLAALALRAGSALLGDAISYDARMHTASLAGVLGWLAVVIFALSVARAVRAEPATKRTLEELAANARRP